MRKLALLLVASTVLLMGCHFNIHDGVAGSGKRATQKRDVSPFKSISLEGAYTAEIVCQKDLSVELEADDNILPLLKTEVTDNVLRIKSVQPYSVSEPVVVRISVPNLEGLNVSGAGKIEITGMKNDRFELDANGAPSIKIAGTTNVVDIDTAGAAKIDAHKLHASKAVVDSKGVSQVEVDVADQLDVKIAGPSKVTYDGNPTVNKTIAGPGKVEKKASTGA
ncbi:MAG: hypothetical protein C5B55_05930 [Blastocatellia bacterium]|nr:MAG: hypothetical protein C5B55_05930 [Blastocatellia bacterium]